MIESVFKLLNKDGSTSAENVWDIRNFESYDIPIIYLNGSINGMTKDDKVTLAYIWKEHSGTCTLKWQGNSSITMFQKKNYTIVFDNAFEVVDGWGEQKKYCLKSNFNDPSQYRNLLCATLWGNTVKSRTVANTNLNALPNGGAVDGFPVIIALNGEFHGLYTWNIPKDAWLFDMTDTSKQQAIVCADIPGDGTCFKAMADFTNDFELEYSSDDTSDWVLSSLNRLISAVMESDGTNITYGITPYIDWDSAIDYYIHTVLTKGTDAVPKNYILVTFDGTKWMFSAYDMDTVFGITDYGASFSTAQGTPNFVSMASQHALFAIIWKYMRPQLRARYKQVRESIYNEIQISYLAYNFASKIPLPVSLFDMMKHNRVTASNAGNIEQILTYLRLRVMEVDKWIENTAGETSLPEQVNPAIPTLSSISATYAGGNVPIGTELTALTGITVTATYSDGTKSVVTGYNLSGTIAEGTNTITVTYEDKTTTFTVTGVKVSAYTNLVPTSIDASGNIYNGTGYKEKTRLSSSGSEKTSDYYVAFGYMPVKGGDTIRFKGKGTDGTDVIWYDPSETGSYICVYDADFNFLYAGLPNGSYSTNSFVKSMRLENAVSVIELKDVANIAYFRMSVFHTHSALGMDGETAIITVNQEITD